MQVPERLSLIGGSILLASTLIFTLKSQASNILPKVDSGMSAVFHDDSNQSNNSSSNQQNQQQTGQDFNNNFQQAQQKGWQTGYWGTAKFYVDNNQNNMHVGSGQLNGSFSKVVNDQQIKTISLDDRVQAPQDSGYLFADNFFTNDTTLTQINGLSYLDTSQTTNMYGMFHNDIYLNKIDLSHFDTSNVTSMGYMFNNNHNLSNLDVSNFDTQKVHDMVDMFGNNSNLSNLNVSHFDTSHISDMEDMFASDNIHQLTLSQNINLQNDSSYFNYNVGLDGTYQSNGQTLNLDGNAHPGTWVRQ